MVNRPFEFAFFVRERGRRSSAVSFTEIETRPPVSGAGSVALCLACHDEVCVLAAMLLKVADQFKVAPVEGQPLYHRHIKHIRQAGVADGEYLFPDGVSHRWAPPRRSRWSWAQRRSTGPFLQQADPDPGHSSPRQSSCSVSGFLSCPSRLSVRSRESQLQ